MLNATLAEVISDDYLSNGRNNRRLSVLQGVIEPLEEKEIALQAERIGWFQRRRRR